MSDVPPPPAPRHSRVEDPRPTLVAQARPRLTAAPTAGSHETGAETGAQKIDGEQGGLYSDGERSPDVQQPAVDQQLPSDQQSPSGPSSGPPPEDRQSALEEVYLTPLHERSLENMPLPHWDWLLPMGLPKEYRP